MTPEQAIEELYALTARDPENAHSRADDILIELLLGIPELLEVAEAWQAAEKRIGFWYA